jgi:hypothetical protein
MAHSQRVSLSKALQHRFHFMMYPGEQVVGKDADKEMRINALFELMIIGAQAQ